MPKILGNVGKQGIETSAGSLYRSGEKKRESAIEGEGKNDPLACVAGGFPGNVFGVGDWEKGMSYWGRL